MENKKLRLCFLANIEDNHSRKWVKYFMDNNYEIHWISFPSKYISEVQNKNVKIYLIKDFKSKSFNILFNILLVRKLLHKIKPSLLHVHYAGVNGALGALSGFHPFLLTAHGSDILIAPKSRLVRPLIKFALQKADLITCDAEHIRGAMIKLGADSLKIKIIYFGVDTQLFCLGQKPKELEEKLQIFDSPVVISLRVLVPIYDVETLIKAIPQVLKKIPETKFIIAGKGSEEERLKKLAVFLGVSQSIRFIGWIEGQDLPQYLRLADVYVSTSLSDAGLSSSTAEAMACGLPPVITDFGDNKKWVKDGKNGFLIPVRNPEILAEKIVYLLQNKNISKRFGEISRTIIEEKNNYHKEMEKMERIYEEVTRNHEQS